MKESISYILFFGFSNSGLNQNLVPNSSFENYTLPTNGYNETRFNSCIINCWVSPNDIDGFAYSSLAPVFNTFPMDSGVWLDEQFPRTGLTKMVIEQVFWEETG